MFKLLIRLWSYPSKRKLSVGLGNHGWQMYLALVRKIVKASQRARKAINSNRKGFPTLVSYYLKASWKMRRR